MTLLDALILLAKDAESRRVEMRELYAAVGRVAEAIGRELRDGDEVIVDDHVFCAFSFTRDGQRVRSLMLDGRLLGEKTPSMKGVAWVSLAETRWFARKAEDVARAFSYQLQRDARHLKTDRQTVGSHGETP